MKKLLLLAVGGIDAVPAVENADAKLWQLQHLVKL